jgi:hypothetical protein
VIAVVGAACGFEFPPQAAAPTARTNTTVTAPIRRSARAATRPPLLRRYLDTCTDPASHPPGWVGHLPTTPANVVRPGRGV